MTAGLIDGLVRGGSVWASVDPLPDERRGQRVVDASAPTCRPGWGKALGMTCLDQRLAAAVLALLAQVVAQAPPPPVPDERRRMEADLPVAVEDLPARVHVVPGLGVDGVEPADLGENEFPKGHVAAGDVLGAIVG